MQVHSTQAGEDPRFADTALVDAGFCCADLDCGPTFFWERVAPRLERVKLGRLTRFRRGSLERFKAQLPSAA